MPLRMLPRHIAQPWLLAAVLLLIAVAAKAQVTVPNLIYTTIKPCRILDTRYSAGGKLVAGVPQTFNIVGSTTGTYFTNQGGPSGGCSIPGFALGVPQVQAVVINLTIAGPSASGYLNAWASDQLAPATSILNFPASSTLVLANAVTLSVRQDTQGGDITASTTGTVDVFGDVVGYFSANSVTPATTGYDNVLLGAGAGNPISGLAAGNVGIGNAALASVTTGSTNTAVGHQAMRGTTNGAYNVAIGTSALGSQTSGFSNTALGYGALPNPPTGSNNIGVGFLAGSSFSGSESNNIDIGNGGVTGESGVIRIGTASSQTATYIAGIYGTTSSSGSAVYVNSNGQLGTSPSSQRFKEDVHDMGEASAGLLKLRPVTFHYKQQYDDGSHLLQYGLIAEEVAKVFPGLVQYDEDGQPLAVRYQFINAMLLNEVQAQHEKIANEESLIDRQQAQLVQLQMQLEEVRQEIRALAQQSPPPPRQ